MSARPSLDELCDRQTEFPDPDAQLRLGRLLGLDDYKLRLTKMLGLLVHPAGLNTWGGKHHKVAKQLLDLVVTRPPLVVLVANSPFRLNLP